MSTTVIPNEAKRNEESPGLAVVIWDMSFNAFARNEEPSPALRDELTEGNLQPNGKMQEMRERISINLYA
jgi:hypothetical protein